MHRSCDCIDETLIRIRREVHDNIGSGATAAETSMSSITSPSAPFGSPGEFVRLIDRNCRDLRSGLPEALEVRRDIGRAVSSAEFEYADRLPRRLRIRREPIELCHLHWRIAHVSCAGLRIATVRLRLRPIVESQHCFHVRSDFLRQRNLPSRSRSTPAAVVCDCSDTPNAFSIASREPVR